MLEGMLDIIFPYLCVGCGFFASARRATQFPWWCAECERMVQSAELGITRTIQENKIYAAYKFSCEPVAQTIHALKYMSVVGAAQLCAHWVAKILPKKSCIIIPVPLHPRRQSERGFNQAALIAREISYITGAHTDENLISRTRYTTPQAHSSAEDRREQLSGAFTATHALDPHTEYIVLDDVVTTGSTMVECIEALRMGGAHHVRGIAVASA